MKLRVLHILSSSGLYGAERTILNLAGALADVSFSAAVFQNGGPESLAFLGALREAGVQARGLPSGWRKTPAAVRLLLRPPLQADVIHAHGYKGIAAGLLLAFTRGLPLLATQHGFTGESLKARLYTRLDLACCRLERVRTVICVSRDIVRRYREAGVDPAKLVLLPNALPLQHSEARERRLAGEQASGPRVLLYLGRLSPEKGPDVLLKALARLPETPFILHVVGDGPLRSELERLAAAPPLAGRVVFRGFQADIKKFLEKADIFVLPSLTEGTPMSLLEAMSLGLPCAASAVGETPAVLEEGAGLLSPAGDVQALAANLELLLRAPASSLAGMGRHGQRIARERYSMRNYAATMRALYARVSTGGL